MESLKINIEKERMAEQDSGADCSWIVAKKIEAGWDGGSGRFAICQITVFQILEIINCLMRRERVETLEKGRSAHHLALPTFIRNQVGRACNWL